MFDDTFATEFVGGSKDGEVIKAKVAPRHYEVKVDRDFTEVYERQNEEPPFTYLQMGYTKRESWR